MTSTDITVPGPVWIRCALKARKGAIPLGTYKGTVHVVDESTATCELTDPTTGRTRIVWVHVSCLSPR